MSNDAERGWAYDVGRDGEQRTVLVEVAGTLDAGHGDLPDDVRRALSTHGRSAVDAVLDDDPPERLTVTTNGVFTAD